MGRPRTRVCLNCKHNYGGMCYALPPQFSGGFQVRPTVEDDDWCSLFAKQPEAKTDKKNSGPTTNKVIDYYMTLYTRKHGSRPIIDAKDRAAAKKLAETLDPETLKLFLEEFVMNPPEWYADKGLLSLCHASGAIKKMMSKKHAANSGNKRSVVDTIRFIERQGALNDTADRELWSEYCSYVTSTFNQIGYEDWLDEEIKKGADDE